MVSTKSRYALRALCVMAVQKEGIRLSIADISKDQKLPAKYMEQIFFKLKKAGIITSYRGKNGGYTLLKPAGEITVLQVVNAVEDSFEPAPCVLTGVRAPFCEDITCYTKGLWEEVYDSIKDLFNRKTIEDLIKSL